MEIKVNTKFEIGQPVYVCRNTIRFSKGKFIKVTIPKETPIKIEGITILCTLKESVIFYNFRLSNGCLISYSQDEVFETLEDAKNMCTCHE